MDSLIAPLTLHIVALLVWAGALLCMPVLFAEQAATDDAGRRQGLQLMQRWLYANVMTPAALIAVAAGTWLVFERRFEGGWLHVKLALVLLLSWFHIHCGHVMVKLKQEGPKHRPGFYAMLAVVPAVLTVAIVWLVTGKPF